MLTVGYERATYAEKRNIIDKIKNVTYKKIASSGVIVSPIPLNEEEIYNSACVRSDSCDIAHFFNQINFGDAPYVTTFETRVPRYWRRDVFACGAQEALKASCLKLLAMSASAYAITKASLREIAPAVHDRLMEKIMVLHPPQEIIANAKERFTAPETVRFVFLGNFFFTKGGLAVFRAFDRVRRRFPDMALTVISTMDTGYNVTKAGEKEKEEAALFLYRNRAWVTWYKNISNDKVLALLPEHHVGLLPSFAETYGYAVLEMQAAGIPVITTDIRAFPEINPDDAGWRIALPGGGLTGSSARELTGGSTREDIAHYEAAVQHGLENILTDIMENQATLKEKSQAAQARIRACHCPKAHARTLLAVYEGRSI